MHSLLTFKEAGIHKKTTSSCAMIYKLNAKIYAKECETIWTVTRAFVPGLDPLGTMSLQGVFLKVNSQLRILSSAITQYTAPDKQPLPLLLLKLVQEDG